MTTHEEFEKFLLDISCGYGDLIILVDPQEANEARQRYLNGRKKALATYEDQAARIAELENRGTSRTCMERETFIAFLEAGQYQSVISERDGVAARMSYLETENYAMAQNMRDAEARIVELEATVAVEHTTAENRLELLRTKDSHIGDLEWAIKCACDFLYALQGNIGIGEETALMLQAAVNKGKQDVAR